jgi:hypothetical protein
MGAIAIISRVDVIPWSYRAILFIILGDSDYWYSEERTHL